MLDRVTCKSTGWCSKRRQGEPQGGADRREGSDDTGDEQMLCRGDRGGESLNDASDVEVSSSWRPDGCGTGAAWRLPVCQQHTGNKRPLEYGLTS